MFWKSVVGKLAMTILLLVSFVLFILTMLLLEFFETFHIQEAEKDMLQTATKVSDMVETYEDYSIIIDTAKRIKNPESKVVISFADGSEWTLDSNDDLLTTLNMDWLERDQDLNDVIEENDEVKKQMILPDNDVEVMIVGVPASDDGAVFVYQSLDVIDQTKAETTKIIFLCAGIAIILTIIFAFFLSTRITAPLIKMREAAFDLTKGEFNTRVPILTHDEIGELAMAFNRMGKQLNFHINALQQEKEQLSGILSSMADGVVTLNRNGEMIVTNPPADRFLDDWYFEKNIPTSQKNNQLPEELNDILQEVIQGEKEVLKEISIQGRIWVMIMTPLYDQNYIRGAVAVVRDMTEERRSDKLRKDFIANVSHELRTPISMLQGYSEAIVDDIVETKEEKNELAQIIYEESLRLNRLVNDLLDLGRMESGQVELRKEQIEIEPYTQRIINKFNGVAADQQIDLKLNMTIKTECATFDPDAIEQVFINLIDNALRHTEEKGFVQVDVFNDEEEFSVSVRDNGHGIPEEDLPFVFERFYKADKARTRNGQKKGTGLGLSIVKNIIDAHGGVITVKSKQNEGTTFNFKIPQNEWV